GPVYQAGTLSGNPLAMAGGLATVRALTPALHERIAGRTAELVRGVREIAARHGVPFSADHAGTMWGFFFRERLPRSFAEAQQVDVALFKRFFHAACRRGLSFAPSPYEASFMSAAHGVRELEQTFERFDDALRAAITT